MGGMDGMDMDAVSFIASDILHLGHRLLIILFTNWTYYRHNQLTQSVNLVHGYLQLMKQMGSMGGGAGGGADEPDSDDDSDDELPDLEESQAD